MNVYADEWKKRSKYPCAVCTIFIHWYCVINAVWDKDDHVVSYDMVRHMKTGF